VVLVVLIAVVPGIVRLAAVQRGPGRDALPRPRLHRPGRWAAARPGTPIYNEPSCSTAACHAHPERQNVLGVLDVALDLGATDRLIGQARRRVVVTTVVEAALIWVFVVVLVGLFVTRPSTASSRLTSPLGAWTSNTPSRSPPAASCGAFAGSFNRMRDRLREALGKINRAAQEVEAKVAERTAQLQQAQRHLLKADRLCRSASSRPNER